MNARGFRALAASTLLVGFALLTAPGCDGGTEVSQAPPSAELKASESKYGAQIEKNKESAAKDKEAKKK